MERYFIIKDKGLIKLYHEYKFMIAKLNSAFCEFCKKHDIEAKQYYMSATNLHIVATENDVKKFSSQIRKNTDGLFRRNSELAKEWVLLCKENEIETPHKPVWQMSSLINAKSGLFENRFHSRMFEINGILYGSYGIDRDWELTNTEAFQELKASEFWKIVEDAENSEVK